MVAFPMHLLQAACQLTVHTDDGITWSREHLSYQRVKTTNQYASYKRKLQRVEREYAIGAGTQETNRQRDCRAMPLWIQRRFHHK